MGEARGIWTMSAKRPTEKGLEVKKEKSAMSGDYAVDAQYDRFMIVSKALPDGSETSDVYALTSANLEALTLGNGMRVIQVLKSEVRSYDGGKSSSFFHLLFPTSRRSSNLVVYGKCLTTAKLGAYVNLRYFCLLFGALSGNKP